MNLSLIYTVGILVACAMALIWSFVLDKNKPSTAKEFTAKLVVRALFIIVILAFVVGLLTMVLDV